MAPDADTAQPFDRRLVTARQARAVRLGARPGFLDDFAADEIADRLAAVTRSFGDVLIAGPAAPRLAARIGAAATPRVMPEADLERLAPAPSSLDCILVPLGPELVNDLPGLLARLRAALRPDGLMIAALFAAGTLAELRRAWLDAEVEHAGGAAPRVAPFADIRDLGGLLQRAGFALPVVDVEDVAVRYPSGLALMRELKAMGYANPLAERSRRPVTAGLLAAAASAYDGAFADADGRVRASFRIAFLTGWAPHDSQPKPLKPGSARMRLADALRTRR